MCISVVCVSSLRSLISLLQVCAVCLSHAIWPYSLSASSPFSLHAIHVSVTSHCLFLPPQLSVLSLCLTAWSPFAWLLTAGVPRVSLLTLSASWWPLWGWRRCGAACPGCWRSGQTWASGSSPWASTPAWAGAAPWGSPWAGAGGSPAPLRSSPACRKPRGSRELNMVNKEIYYIWVPLECSSWVSRRKV